MPRTCPPADPAELPSFSHEAELVRRAQAGERAALVHLVEREYARVYTLAIAVLRSRADAADATQETLVRLLRSLHTFRGDDGATFSTWLHRLTVNVCLDALRRQQRAPLPLATTTQQGDDSGSVIECVDNDAWVQPEQRAVQDESAAELRTALASLSAPQRDALSLLYFEDTSYEQVAATMGLPLNTVKSHALRGKERLGRLLGIRGRASPVQRVLA